MRRLLFIPALRRALAALLVAGGVAAVAPQALTAQSPPRREVRAVWLATVGGLDWPKTTNAAAQRSEMLRQLDEFRASGLNTVIYQVRPESDAHYRSAIEPFAHTLTGQQGGDPGYDPLEFVVREAHARGMEVHAWFNPYRVQANSGSYATAPTHVSNTHPEWLLSFPQSTGSTLRMLDPGKQAVRNYVTRVVADVVRRYDIDGVHFDDYFYPYSGITTQDDATFAAENRGIRFRTDWRRDNVNLFVAQVRDSIQAIRPSVKFGISPFGIWRNGVPTGITGMDAYSVIYADAPEWMALGLLDYLTPQLYWRFGGGQDYAKLLPWWKTVMNGRHLYPGLITSTGEIPRMIRFNRDNGLSGHVLFRSLTILGNDSRVNDSLRVKLFTRPALPLVMPWKGDTAPPLAPWSVIQTGAPGSVTVTWAAPAPAPDGDGARWYAVQRIPAGGSLDLTSSDQLIALVGASQTSVRYTGPAATGDRFVVLAYDDNWNESAPSNTSFPVAADGSAVTAGDVTLGVSPSPARGAVTIRYRLPAGAGTSAIEVFDTLGRRVATLAAEGGSERQAVWEAAVPPGVYVVRLAAGVASASQRLVVVR